jgi:hypothetical protein
MCISPCTGAVLIFADVSSVRSQEEGLIGGAHAYHRLQHERTPASNHTLPGYYHSHSVADVNISLPFRLDDVTLQHRYHQTNGLNEMLELPDYSFVEHFGHAITSYPPRAVMLDYLQARFTVAVAAPPLPPPPPTLLLLLPMLDFLQGGFTATGGACYPPPPPLLFSQAVPPRSAPTDRGDWPSDHRALSCRN